MLRARVSGAGLGQPGRPAGDAVGQGGQIAVQRDQGGGAPLPLGDQLFAASDQAGEPMLEVGQLAGETLVVVQRGQDGVPGGCGGRPRPVRRPRLRSMPARPGRRRGGVRRRAVRPLPVALLRRRRSCRPARPRYRRPRPGADAGWIRTPGSPGPRRAARPVRRPSRRCAARQAAGVVDGPLVGVHRGRGRGRSLLQCGAFAGEPCGRRCRGPGSTEQLASLHQPAAAARARSAAAGRLRAGRGVRRARRRGFHGPFDCRAGQRQFGGSLLIGLLLVREVGQRPELPASSRSTPARVRRCRGSTASSPPGGRPNCSPASAAGRVDSRSAAAPLAVRHRRCARSASAASSPALTAAAAVGAARSAAARSARPAATSSARWSRSANSRVISVQRCWRECRSLASRRDAAVSTRKRPVASTPVRARSARSASSAANAATQVASARSGRSISPAASTTRAVWVSTSSCRMASLAWESRRIRLNHSSMSPNRPVSNKRSSRSSRSAVSARRNRAKSPCGSSTTWKNWSADMPRRSLIASPTSSARVRSVAEQSAGPGPIQRSSTRCRSVVRPRPFGLGPLVLRIAGDGEADGADGGLEGDFGAGVWVGQIATQPLGVVADAGDAPEQRERHGIQQGGLARARLAVQQEQPIGG